LYARTGSRRLGIDLDAFSSASSSNSIDEVDAPSPNDKTAFAELSVGTMTRLPVDQSVPSVICFKGANPLAV
jgi:hypothetical protein